MKKIFKILGLLALGIILLFLIVANFSSVQSSFQCSGEVSKEGSTRPMTVYIKLEQYRWWVNLWSDSDGSLNLEIPNIWVEYYGRLVEVGDQLQIYEGYTKQTFKGSFSTLSKALAIKIPFGFFEGSCNAINN